MYKKRLFTARNRLTFLSIYVFTIGFILWGYKFIGWYQCIPRSVQALSRKSMLTIADDHQTRITHLPLIYIVTPTVNRIERKADLTRLSQTLRLVPRIHWIVVEDSETLTGAVSNLLYMCKLNYTHLAIKTPAAFVLNKAHYQRNYGLEWITEHAEFPSIFYFADDDNTYDIRIFEEMRYTKRISVWPVGLIGLSYFQTPVVRNGKVVGFASGWSGGRKFPIDMAGFAINSEVLKQPNPPRFRDATIVGRSESDFLDELNITINEFEPKADNCTKVLVWHTRTEKSPLENTAKLKEMLKKYNLSELEV